MQVQLGQSYISRGLQLYPKDSEEEAEDSLFDETFLAKYNLTRRELEILGLIAQAKSNAEIADGLFISPQTVGAHRKNIMRKLNISTTAGLVRFAIENQLGWPLTWPILLFSPKQLEIQFLSYFWSPSLHFFELLFYF